MPRFVGLSKDLEMLWTGDTIDAEEAQRIELVNKVVPAEKLAEATGEMTCRSAQGPEVAIKIIKGLVCQEQAWRNPRPQIREPAITCQ